jgi:hypothetical protein
MWKRAFVAPIHPTCSRTSLPGRVRDGRGTERYVVDVPRSAGDARHPRRAGPAVKPAGTLRVTAKAGGLPPADASAGAPPVASTTRRAEHSPTAMAREIAVVAAREGTRSARGRPWRPQAEICDVRVNDLVSAPARRDKRPARITNGPRSLRILQDIVPVPATTAGRRSLRA